MPASAGRCVVDVCALLSELSLDDTARHAWSLYARRERELVFRQGPDMQRPGIESIVGIHRHGDPEMLRPVRGKDAWNPDAEDALPIHAVEDHQPDINAGIWWVRLAGHAEAPVAVEWNEDARSWDMLEASMAPDIPLPG